jgi:hypothetical protein
MYGEMGSKSNTMLFQDKPADFNALMAQVATVFSNTTAQASEYKHTEAEEAMLAVPPPVPHLAVPDPPQPKEGEYNF